MFVINLVGETEMTAVIIIIFNILNTANVQCAQPCQWDTAL